MVSLFFYSRDVDPEVLNNGKRNGYSHRETCLYRNEKTEADQLLSRFLQEEAFQYVEYSCNHLGELWCDKAGSSELLS